MAVTFNRGICCRDVNGVLATAEDLQEVLAHLRTHEEMRVAIRNPAPISKIPNGIINTALVVILALGYGDARARLVRSLLDLRSPIPHADF